MHDEQDKKPVEQQPPQENYSGPKWGYRLLIIFGIFAVINVVSQLTLQSKFAGIYIALITGLFLVLLILGILNRITKSMFEESHHQYGFYLLVFLLFSLYGNSTNYRDMADLAAYSNSPEFNQMVASAAYKYLSDNPAVDTLSSATQDSIAYSVILRSQEGYSILSRAWEHRIMGYSSSFPFFVFLALFIISYGKFKIANFRLRRKWDKEHGLS